LGLVAERPTISVRAASGVEWRSVASLHAGGIEEGFLSSLGVRFLGHLYRRVMRTPSAFLLVADDGVRPVGFVAGSGDVARLYRDFVVHDGIVAAFSAGVRLLRHPRQVTETLGHRNSRGSTAKQGAELLAIAVEPGAQGRGVGAQLVGAFLETVASHGLNGAYVVVGADNTAAISLYERFGFKTVERFELHAGTTSCLMQWVPLSPPTGRPG
jgi:ribosomal protein S18 acetylase RimI-like enzyme